MNDDALDPSNSAERKQGSMASSCGGEGASHSVIARVYDFEELAVGASSVTICIGQSLYTLRRTRAGKLILNK